jgi:Polyketide cyclase / dehydrase and lipid transport
MTRITTSIRIRRPVGEVFDYVTTPANWPVWHPASISVSGSSDHPLRLGEEIVEEFVAGGRRGRATWRVTRRKAPHRWRIEASSPQGQAVISYLLSAEGIDTVFRRDLSYDMPKAWLALLDLLVLRRRMDRESRIALQRLKLVLEGSHRNERSNASTRRSPPAMELRMVKRMLDIRAGSSTREGGERWTRIAPVALARPRQCSHSRLVR